MTMARVRVAWQNWPGAPGLSTFYLDPPVAQAQVDAIRTFFNSLVGLIPQNLTIQVPSTGDTFNEATGELTGTWTVGTTPTVVTGTAVGAYAGNAGAVVHWLTGTVINRRRVRGRTFLVPLSGSAFDTSGSILASALTTIQNAANALLTANSPDLLVWSRPRPGQNGTPQIVTGTRVPDLAVSLRSRRI